MQIPTTLWSHAPTLAAIAMTGWLLLRYFPGIVAICTKNPERRRVALEVRRLQRKDAAKIPTYLVPGDLLPEKTHPRKRKALAASKQAANRSDSG